MTLKEFTGKLLIHISENPETLDMEVQVEGCDCYGDANGEFYVYRTGDMVDHFLIKRDL